jgi:hypothetical protein
MPFNSGVKPLTTKCVNTSDYYFRSVHVAGKLTFDPTRDTRLDVGLLKIQAGDDASENGFDCDAHVPTPDASRPRPTLEVGTAEKPVAAGHTARIRLVYFEGMDRQSCPAIVSCGGRMEFHGAPMSRSWVKLGATAKSGDTVVRLAEPVTGWRVGDRVILTATQGQGTGFFLHTTFRSGGQRPLPSLAALPAEDQAAIHAALAAKEAGRRAELAARMAEEPARGMELALRNRSATEQAAESAALRGLEADPAATALAAAHWALEVAETRGRRSARLPASADP